MCYDLSCSPFRAADPQCKGLVPRLGSRQGIQTDGTVQASLMHVIKR